MVEPKDVCLFIPGNLKKFKLDLFERIGRHITSRGGMVIKSNIEALASLPDHVIPIVGCMPELTELILKWKASGRPRVQWDRGYCRRVFATWLPRGENGGMYRWHLNSFQLRRIFMCPSDRWDACKTPVAPWQKNGRHIVVAAPTPTYAKFHQIEGWTDQVIRDLAKLTDRQIVVRHKDSKRPLQADLLGAHCVVAHGSIAAVEAVICGCPVFDHHESAAALVGLTDIRQIEKPIYPDRQPWLNALGYSQYDERELTSGVLWSLLR